VIVFAAANGLGAGYLLAATIAFAFALTNNFAWNRHWTFRAGHGRLSFQWPRFLIVNLAVFGFSLVVLHLLIGAGVARVGAQAIAVALAAPPNYLGQKLWSFVT
jgi:putative flippase GtrA